MAEAGRGLVTSTDLKMWTVVQTAPVDIGNIAYGNGWWIGFVNGNVYRSTDGLTWSQVLGAFQPGSSGSVTFAAGLFVKTTDRLSTSPDGVTWTQRLPLDSFMYAAAWGAGRWVAIPACATSPSPSLAYASSDGLTWTTINSAILVCGNGIAYGPGGFAVLVYGSVSPTRDAQLLLSADGLTWNRRMSEGSVHASSLQSGAGRWVIGSAFGGILASTGALSPQKSWQL